jgi:hypothetical protein
LSLAPPTTPPAPVHKGQPCPSTARRRQRLGGFLAADCCRSIRGTNGVCLLRHVNGARSARVRKLAASAPLRDKQLQLARGPRENTMVCRPMRLGGWWFGREDEGLPGTLQPGRIGSENEISIFCPARRISAQDQPTRVGDSANFHRRIHPSARRFKACRRRKMAVSGNNQSGACKLEIVPLAVLQGWCAGSD